MNDFEKEIVDYESNYRGFNFALYLTPPREEKREKPELTSDFEKLSLNYDTESSLKNLLEDKEFLPNDLFQKINEVSPTKSIVSSGNILNLRENENFEDKIDLLELTTSNFTMHGKKLTIITKSPFCELANRDNVLFGCLSKAIPRILDGKLAYSDTNTSPILPKPLSKDKLRLFVEYLFKNFRQL